MQNNCSDMPQAKTVSLVNMYLFPLKKSSNFVTIFDVWLAPSFQGQMCTILHFLLILPLWCGVFTSDINTVVRWESWCGVPTTNINLLFSWILIAVKTGYFQSTLGRPRMKSDTISETMATLVNMFGVVSLIWAYASDRPSDMHVKLKWFNDLWRGTFGEKVLAPK